MSKRFISILLTVAMIIVSLSAAVPKAYADTSTATQKAFDLVIEPTDIECTGVFNRAGYGIVSFSGPEEVGGTGNYWTWNGVVDRSGKYVVPAKPVENDRGGIHLPIII